MYKACQNHDKTSEHFNENESDYFMGGTDTVFLNKLSLLKFDLNQVSKVFIR